MIKTLYFHCRGPSWSKKKKKNPSSELLANTNIIELQPLKAAGAPQLMLQPHSVVVVWLLSCVWLFCDPMDCNHPGSSVHGISQARVLEWVAISFSRGSSWPRDKTHIFYLGRWILYHGATREAHNHGTSLAKLAVLVLRSPLQHMLCLFPALPSIPTSSASSGHWKFHCSKPDRDKCFITRRTQMHGH